MFWALVVIVTFKYVVLMMRADNRGEGGQLALTALISHGLDRDNRLRWWLVGFGIFGAAMFFGDAMITPAISVLSAVEGIEIVTPALNDYIVPATVVIMIALFAIQKHGTASVGKLFGPVTLLWFVDARRARDRCRSSITPACCARCRRTTLSRFVTDHPLDDVPGAGRRRARGHRHRGAVHRHGAFRPRADPPCVAVLRVSGAGAQLLRPGRAAAAISRRRSRIPFYLLAPSWFLVPLVVLATCATIVASQAVISGRVLARAAGGADGLRARASR